jgi:predicted dehydrogenase
MSRPWRGALIGCGFFAPTQLHAWKSIAGVEIVALCDQDLSKARGLGSTFGIAATYDDAAAMLDREELDFIDIVTTTPSHRPLVELGAKHGKLIVCQKPFAETLEDADAMVDACRDAKVSLIIHENFRWQRPFLTIAERLRDGAIGRPHCLRLEFRHGFDI